MSPKCPSCGSEELTVLGANSSGWLTVCDVCGRMFELEDRLIEQGGTS